MENSNEGSQISALTTDQPWDLRRGVVVKLGNELPRPIMAASKMLDQARIEFAHRRYRTRARLLTCAAVVLTELICHMPGKLNVRVYTVHLRDRNNFKCNGMRRYGT